MKRNMLILMSVMFWVLVSVVGAQEREPIRVKSSIFEPMVIQDSTVGPMTGFDVDYLELLMQEIGQGENYEHGVVGFNHRFSVLEKDEADMVISGITITEEREKRVDFVPYFSSGLRIMTLIDQSRETPFWKSFWNGITLKPMWRLLKTFAQPDFLELIISILVFALFWAHIVFFFEKVPEAEASKMGNKYWPGIIWAFYYVITLKSTVGLGDINPQIPRTAMIAVVIIFVGIGSFSNITGMLSAEHTTEMLEGVINGPEDLRGKVVGTKAGTPYVALLEKLGAEVVTTRTITECYHKLYIKKIDAIVYDEVNLLYYAKNDGLGQVKIVDGTFARMDYGIALPQGSDLREPLARAVLHLQENKEFDKLFTKWFGSIL